MWFIVILSHLTEDGTAFTYESNHSLPHRSGDSCDLKSRKGQTRQTVSNPSNQHHRDVKSLQWPELIGWLLLEGCKWQRHHVVSCQTLEVPQLFLDVSFSRKEMKTAKILVLFYLTPKFPKLQFQRFQVSSLGHGITTTKTKEDHQGWHQGNDPPTSRILWQRE